MSLSNQLNVALKEWAVVCAALAGGRQIILLRKGGVYETGGEFEVEHRQFFLYPTFAHQSAVMLKDSEHARLAPPGPEPARVKIEAAAIITDIIAMPNRQAMDRLEDEHIWTTALIDMRYQYRPENPLYLLFLRTYRLSRPIEFENTPAYAGCKSWVSLEKPIAIGQATPALDDAAYAARVRGILDRVWGHG